MKESLPETEPSNYWVFPENEKHLKTNEARAELRVCINQIERGFAHILLIVVAGFLLYQVKLMLDWYHLENHAHATIATVTTVKELTDEDGDSAGYEVSYKYSSEERALHGKSILSNKPPYSEGDRIQVLYDEESPLHSLLLEHDSVWEYAPHLKLVFFIFVFVYLIHRIALSQQRTVEHLKRDGSLIEGEVMDVMLNTNSDDETILAVKIAFDSPKGETIHFCRGIDDASRVPERGAVVHILYLSKKQPYGLL